MHRRRSFFRYGSAPEVVIKNLRLGPLDPPIRFFGIWAYAIVRLFYKPLPRHVDECPDTDIIRHLVPPKLAIAERFQDSALSQCK